MCIRDSRGARVLLLERIWLSANTECTHNLLLASAPFLPWSPSYTEPLPPNPSFVSPVWWENNVLDLKDCIGQLLFSGNVTYLLGILIFLFWAQPLRKSLFCKQCSVLLSTTPRANYFLWILLCTVYIFTNPQLRPAFTKARLVCLSSPKDRARWWQEMCVGNSKLSGWECHCFVGAYRHFTQSHFSTKVGSMQSECQLLINGRNLCSHIPSFSCWPVGCGLTWTMERAMPELYDRQNRALKWLWEEFQSKNTMVNT